MRTWFADSHYYFALLSATDESHERAVRIRSALHCAVTSTCVLTEVADGLAAPDRRAAFIALLKTLRSSRSVEIVSADEALFERAVEFYESRPDKAWSLTDCTSFVIMEERGLKEALTADHHFEQAGFVALLK